MSCQQVPAAPALNPYPRSVQVGEFEVATDGGIWVAIRATPASTEQLVLRQGAGHERLGVLPISGSSPLPATRL
jgi:hypothetical protein